MAIIWAGIAAVMLCAAIMTAYITLVIESQDYDKPDEIAVVSRRFDAIDPETATLTYPVPLDQELQDYIVETAKSYGVSPCIVFAIIGAESEYKADAKGDEIDGVYHSFGLMQIWADRHVNRCLRLNAYNLLDPYQNVRVGIDYLAELLDQGDLDWALSVYSGNGGAACAYALEIQRSAECILEGVMLVA